MPRKAEYDTERLERVLREQHRVIARAQVLSCGISRRALQRRIAQEGSWQRLLPGVYLTLTGTVAQDEREMAALLYARKPSLITGPTAVWHHGLSSQLPGAIDVLVPWEVKRQSVGFVKVSRTRRLPELGYVSGKVRFVDPMRAVADAARMMTSFDDVRAVVCAAVQRRACTLADLITELNQGPSAGSALLRAALAEVADGVRSVAEADFRRLILSSDLPKPMFNARLYDADGEFIAMVDAWWPEAGVAAEVDSRAYHLSAADQDRTTERHDKLAARGILTVHFAPKRMKTDAAGIIGEIRSAIDHGLRRPHLQIRALPPTS